METKKLLNEVFEEVNYDEVSNISGGMSAWQCQLYAYGCIHGIVIGGSGNWSGGDYGGPDLTSCQIYDKYCK